MMGLKPFWVTCCTLCLAGSTPAAAALVPVASDNAPVAVEAPAPQRLLAARADEDGGNSKPRKSRNKKKGRRRAQADDRPRTDDAPPADVAAGGSADTPPATAQASAASGAVTPAGATTSAAASEEAGSSSDVASRSAAEALESQALEAKGFDARVRKLTDALARALKRLPGDVRDQSFAVLPFEVQGAAAENRQLGLVVGDAVVTNLARDHRLRLTERSQLTRILEEQALGAMGVIAPDRAAEVGRIAGAQALILGELLDVGDEIQVGARVVDATSAEILAVEAVRVPAAELLALSADAVVLRSRSGAFFRSLVVPGWGQVYNREPGKALALGSLVGSLAVASGGTLTAALLTHRRYDQFSEESARKAGLDSNRELPRLRVAANSQYTAAAVLLGAGLAAWLGTALEAYASGVDVDSLDRALARE